MPTFDTPGAVTLDLRLPAGEIQIVTSQRPDTDVELQPLRDDETTREALAAARIELQESHGRHVVLVDIPSKRGFFGRQPQFQLRVGAPEGASVACRTRSADVSGSGVFGAVDVKSASGDTAFDVVNEDASVNSASGDVRLGVVRGNLGVNTASGDVLVERAEGAAHLNAVSGDVWLREALGEVHAHTVSGDQKLDAVGGSPVSVQSVSGDILVGIAHGSRVYMNVGSISGDSSSDLEMSDSPGGGERPLIELRANSVSGDIHVARARALQPTATQ